jgi:hypothetical protein
VAASVSLASSQLSEMTPNEHRCIATVSDVVCVALPAKAAQSTEERVHRWLSSESSRQAAARTFVDGLACVLLASASFGG